ncbi:DUF488 domain-containing protein [Fischerella sp. PCC 9605]|uniref:DUF488 domain-containing protein n=1 Tax=Fischerella sp. PCC 9605 TaxID=1173024 RepID=UPI000479B815|nr:DUF488 domain-containing protein [Fischerella sp. PCC 9605]
MNNSEIIISNNPEITLFSIGHSNHNLNYFLELLKSNEIKCIIDVRSIPYSRHNKIFVKNRLSSELSRNGVDYIWMGESLGGRRNDLENAIGFRQDDKYNSDSKYISGVLELLRIALTKPTAIMCSEEDPRRCHRHNIIAHTLLYKLPNNYQINNIKITHIRANGRLEDASSIDIYFQLSLFD